MSDGMYDDTDFTSLASPIKGPLDIDGPSVPRSLAPQQRDRVDSAMSCDIDVIPTATGMYMIQSFTGDPCTYYVFGDSEDTLQCGCSDYLFRANDSESPVQRCKHIWRVHLEINCNLLPGLTDEPLEWLSRRVQQDIALLLRRSELLGLSNTEKRVVGRLQGLQSRIESANVLDCPQIYARWYITVIESDVLAVSHS